ncbi:single Ig IL-1-related receptor isoform X1 [Lissotriton helveticus]
MQRRGRALLWTLGWLCLARFVPWTGVHGVGGRPPVRTDTTSSSCVDTNRFYDHTVWTVQEPVNHLFCPLDQESLDLLRAEPDFDLQWSKDCLPLALGGRGARLSAELLDDGTAFLTFQHLRAEDAGNYTCTLYMGTQPHVSFTTRLTMAVNPCSVPPEFLSPHLGKQILDPKMGARLSLNCTARQQVSRQCALPTWQWLKEGLALDSGSPYTSLDNVWFNNDASERFLSSVLHMNITREEDFGTFTCVVQNSTATFTLNETEPTGHVAAIVFALTILGLLLIGGLLYVKCRLNAKLWYRNKYGDVEMNDGKLYDAYVSYSTASDDKKFANFILKPHLENRYGYKLFLDDKDILPGSEPSAELIMNISRCRRLIVVLSRAYLEQEWCTSNFREGLWRLMELSKKPTFIVFESQYRELSYPAINLLKQYKRALSFLVWRPGSMTPSSDFWKELCLAMPRKLSFRAGPLADPQTQRQEDKDPMLILGTSYLEGSVDPDPEGDLGVRGTTFREPAPRMVVAPRPPAPEADAERGDIDISDLGSRNYGARTDFYCLVTEEDI